MAARILPTPEQLRELLTYDPDTGDLFWKTRSASFFPDTRLRSGLHSCAIWNARYAGTAALTTKHPEGYRLGRVFSVGVLAHRAAWAIYFGFWPMNQIDHIDGDRANNRISNLREATSAENNRNRARDSRNTSGLKGAFWSDDCNKWRSYIWVDGMQLYLGLFETAEAAHFAYCEAAKKHYGEFARFE